PARRPADTAAGRASTPLDSGPGRRPGTVPAVAGRGKGSSPRRQEATATGTWAGRASGLTPQRRRNTQRPVPRPGGTGGGWRSAADGRNTISTRSGAYQSTYSPPRSAYQNCTPMNTGSRYA